MNLKLHLLAVATLATTLMAAPTQCGGIYFSNEAPDIINVKLTNKARELCYSEFAVMHSGIARSPLWSAEHLFGSQLNTKIDRTDDFHPEERLPADERSELADFSRSGFDRGHLANARDRHTEQGEHESFVLSNMIMQDPKNNRGLFSDLEDVTRQLAKKEGELYVISGPLFIGGNIQRVNGRVMVPTKIYKAIFSPSTGQGAAYLMDNTPGDNYQVVSIAQIEQIAGIRLFPKMTSITKQTAMSLPSPRRNSSYGVLTPALSQAPKIMAASTKECGNKRTCREMSSCEEAMFYLKTCEISSLDGNNDGIPCSKLCK